jgi:hypothetical protein
VRAETHELIGIAAARAYLDHEQRLRDVRRNVTTPVPAASSAVASPVLTCICRFLALLQHCKIAGGIPVSEEEQSCTGHHAQSAVYVKFLHASKSCEHLSTRRSNRRRRELAQDLD